MKFRTILSPFSAAIVLLMAILACNLPGGKAAQDNPGITTTATGTEGVPATAGPPPATPTPEVNHIVMPSAPGEGKLVYDVESQSTASEQRAPYGDSYDINRLERPFLQNMTYVPDLDIVTYTVAGDPDWWYVSIELIGTDPNNSLNINYGVELDTNYDGFGDYLIWAHPPYSPTWDTLPVQIYQDTNHDTSGLSAEKSDAPLSTNGYDKLVFNGGVGNADPDMAWIRINAGKKATVEFAFRKSWSGTVFLLGVLADAGLKDPGKLDYVDRFTEEEAGSPVKDKEYYPLKALFAIDNVCREAFGFKPTGYEPQLCPREEPKPPKPHNPPPQACQPPSYCTGSGYIWHQDTCTCEVILY